jgi:DNA-binding transcriptional LysR family regulator
MNLRFVEAFLWVVRLGGVTRAADKLCLTQSAVSSRLAALEEELGVSLIDRRERVFRLTNAGTRFLTYAERLLAVQRELTAEIGAPEPHSMTLRIGAIESVLHTWLIPLVDHLKKLKPHLEFELTIEMTHVITEQLRRGSLDLAFAAMPVSGEAIRVEVLAPMEMAFAGRRGDGERPWSLDDILERDLLTFQRGSQPHAALLEMLKEHGYNGKRVHTVSSISALVRLVEDGFGIATLPAAAIAHMARAHDLARLQTDFSLLPLPVYASHWSHPTAPQIDAVVRDALTFVGALTSPPPAAAPAVKKSKRRRPA